MKSRTTVTLRTQKLKDGRESLMIETYSCGVRKRKSLGLYILPGRGAEIKAKNAESMYIAENELKKAQRSADMGDFGIFSPDDGDGVNFFDYFIECGKSKEAKKTIESWQTALNHINEYERNKNIKIKSINRDWVLGFRNFLLTANTVSGKKKLSQNTAANIYSKLVACMNKAYKQDQIIHSNPCSGVPTIKIQESTREYLTEEEIVLLIDNKLDDGVMFRACIFDCLTGYRWGDVTSLRWSEVKEEYGRVMISKNLQKKKNTTYQVINGDAASLIRPIQSGDGLVFEGIMCNKSMNKYLSDWCAKAGIKKKITFHCLRHTFGTLLINNGVDIYTVCKLMGHKKVETTQIYAKIIDKSKVKAVDSLPNVLNKKDL